MKKLIASCALSITEFEDDTYRKYKTTNFEVNKKRLGETSYRVNQFIPLYTKNGNKYALLCADHIVICDDIKSRPVDFDKSRSNFKNNYTFYDVWTDPNGLLLLVQLSPKMLRLTLIDGDWLNPSDKKVKVKFNIAKPIKMFDILDKKEYKISEKSAIVDIPCGMFRFIDIEVESL